ncbi:hypothetical protein M3I01_006670 [Marinomonas sp. RSW2]|uniref:Transposase IS30-like HTH domain-containing protein n=1 Tax=Marinomonas maritima TaxID=2940935 RepID=A0ABT5WE40_9GAMM|nr:hypothetical protein [Marinomonas maritima]MDE8602609.1 hypothetical protein [Marinomonas maritima]
MARTIATKMERSNKTIAREFRRCPNNKYCTKTAHIYSSAIRAKAHSN